MQRKSSQSATEGRWLGYAHEVVTCPPEHRWVCAQYHAASGPGVDGGNGIRFPGYLGRDYRGVLCVAHVHREPWPGAQPPGVEPFLAAHREFERPRTPEGDAAFLKAVRTRYERVLSGWGPWEKMGPVVGQLGLGVEHVAYANFAKCRQEGTGVHDAWALGRACERDYRMADLVDALRPVAVVTCVLGADPERGAITWRSPNCDPVVAAFHGRWRTDTTGRRLSEWLPEFVERVRLAAAS